MSQVKRDEDGKLWVAAHAVHSLLMARAALAHLYTIAPKEESLRGGIAVIGNYLDWAVASERDDELVKLIDWAPNFVAAWAAIPEASLEKGESLQTAFDLVFQQTVDIARRLPTHDVLLEMKTKAEAGLK